MATFQIHTDSEKENSHFSQKEKTVLGSRTNVLQTIHGGAGAVKEKVTGVGGRSTFAMVNGNTNQARVGGAGPIKAAFREVGNVKVNDENAGFAATNVIAAKKTGAVVPVEQFKTFSVYEDRSGQHVSSTVENAASTTRPITVVDKENCGIEQRVQLVSKSDVAHKDFSINDDDYVLDTTPMSVTDVLSPMSVDRSQISISASKLIEDSSSKKNAEIEEQPLPRNDRQRFFEVAEYRQNILEYFRESEKKHRPKPHYMRRQTDINYSMRTILVDWLVEVSEEYNLDTETLYLSVSYIDRFLSQMSVVRSKLQLVGTAAMYIASKYEEIYPPDVGEFVFITDDTYNKAQVLRMEQIILKILSFDLCTPTAYVFINTYAVMADIPEKLKFLSQYICELSLLEADPYLRFHPSLISAASLALARQLLDYPIWSAELEEITTYRLEDLKEVLLHLCKSHNAAATLGQQAIQEKYKADKYRQVSSIKSIKLSEELFDELARKHNELSTKENKTDASAATAARPNNDNVRRMISLMFN